MPTRNVNLTEHFDSFIEERIATGRFSNASEVVREGLRLLEFREREDEAKLAWLRAAVQEGVEDLENGRSVTLQSSDEISSFLSEVWREESQVRPSSKVARDKVKVRAKRQQRRSA